MFLLIEDYDARMDEDNLDFNTSHVSINQMEEREEEAKQIFQYISCFY